MFSWIFFWVEFASFAARVWAGFFKFTFFVCLDVLVARGLADGIAEGVIVGSGGVMDNGEGSEDMDTR